MTRRDQVLDAALDVLGVDGMRQLTHRRVDERAGLPQGSTSNLFRTRGALLQGLADRLVELDLMRWNSLAQSPSTTQPLTAELVARWVERSLGADRVHTAARYAMFLAAVHEPSLRDTLQRSRDRLLTWAGELQPHAPRERLADVFDQLDGLIFHQLCLPRPRFDSLPAVAKLIGTLADE